jgi:dihydropteroate synthase
MTGGPSTGCEALVRPGAVSLGFAQRMSDSGGLTIIRETCDRSTEAGPMSARATKTDLGVGGSVGADWAADDRWAEADSSLDGSARPLASDVTTSEHHTKVMGIVNLTSDSFASPDPLLTRDDGDHHRLIERAIETALTMVEQGADIIDLGAESTRPGATRVSAEEEARRLLPVAAALVAAGVTVSVDTVRASVARSALELGVAMINDVSGGLADRQMWSTLKDSSASYVLQHWSTPFDHRPSPGTRPGAVVADVITELAERCDQAIAAGVDPRRLILDPGLGFGKTADQSWQLIAAATTLSDVLGLPMLWGASRKRFLATAYDQPTDPWERDDAGVALTSHLAALDVWGVRVHDVAAHRAAIKVVEQIRRAGQRIDWGAPVWMPGLGDGQRGDDPSSSQRSPASGDRLDWPENQGA